MGLFDRFKKPSAPVPEGRIKFKRGFRTSKPTTHTYEMEVELTYKGERLGIIPIFINSPSRRVAQKRAKDHIEWTVRDIKRKKGT